MEPATGVARLTARRSTAARSAFVVLIASRGTDVVECDSPSFNSPIPERAEYLLVQSCCVAADCHAQGRGRRVGRCIPLPNVELTGRRRVGALAARRMMNHKRLAAKVTSRWRSG
jgi:hypothetical protein